MNRLPADAKPRERLILFGEHTLATHELLAILLRTGSKTESALQVALNLLNYFENLYTLKNASLEELQNIKGIGKVKAIELRAAIEFGKRMFETRQIKLGTILSCQMAGEHLISVMNDLVQEHVVVLFLNTKNEILKQKTIFIGSNNRSIAEPSDIFREALKNGAMRIIIAHNHPSGNPEPSKEDILFTNRLVKAGNLIGVDVLDHLIIGSKTFVSLKERKLI